MQAWWFREQMVMSSILGPGGHHLMVRVGLIWKMGLQTTAVKSSVSRQTILVEIMAHQSQGHCQ